MAQHDLTLFVMSGCPFCIKVKAFMAKNDIEIPERNITTDREADERLVVKGGKHQVPCLFIDGEPLYESDDIIAWMQENLL